MNQNDPLNNKTVGVVDTINPVMADASIASTPREPKDIGTKKMSLSEFGATVKKKYPQYANYADEVIGQKTIERYPEYKDRIEQATPEDQANGNSSYLGKVRNGFDYVAGNVDKAVSGLATLYGGGEGGIANKLLSGVKAGASDIEKGNTLKGVAKSALRTAGDFAQTVYAPVSALLTASGVGKFFEDVQKNVEAGKGLVGEAVNFITDNPSVQEFAKSHPNAGEDFGRALTIALAATDTGKIEPSTVLQRTTAQFNGAMDYMRNEFSSNVGGTGKGGGTINYIKSMDKLIGDGAKPTDIYSNPNMGIYQPNIAKQIVSNGYNVFRSRGLQSLGDQYVKSFGDFTNVTPEMIIQNGAKLVTPSPITSGAVPKSTESAGFFKQFTQEIGDGFRSMIDSPNINPQIKASAQRLQTQYKVDPVSTYDNFYRQEQQFKNDAKADTALGVVGERTGNAFDKVIAQRRLTGEILSEELAKVGNIKVGITPVFDNLNSSITKEGLVYDSKMGSIRPTKNQTKMSTSDVDMLSLYANELGQLGQNPSISQIDGFLSRISNDLDIYKSKNNITGTTNGERIIKGSLFQIREQLSKAADSNSNLADYAKARKTYSELTDFLDEGSSYLGQKTQSGDYARDASLTKSSVQSILNNGKKDWLMKLEDLTGYPALDESILAIQAMKDSGNFRANSLLETLTSGGGIPTPSGIADKVFGWVANKVGEVIKGSPYEQTKSFLQEQSKNQGANAIDAISGTIKDIGSNTAKGAGFVGGKIKDAVMPETALAGGAIYNDADIKQIDNLAKTSRALHPSGFGDVAGKAYGVSKGGEIFMYGLDPEKVKAGGGGGSIVANDTTKANKYTLVSKGKTIKITSPDGRTEFIPNKGPSDDSSDRMPNKEGVQYPYTYKDMPVYKWIPSDYIPAYSNDNIITTYSSNEVSPADGSTRTRIMVKDSKGTPEIWQIVQLPTGQKVAYLEQRFGKLPDEPILPTIINDQKPEQPAPPATSTKRVNATIKEI